RRTRNMHIKPCRLFILVNFFLAGSMGTVAQDKKKPDKKEQPRVTMAIPLGAAPGTKTKFTLRGLKLDTASKVQFDHAKVEVKVLSKGKASVPDKNPDKVGDTQIEVEITLP